MQDSKGQLLHSKTLPEIDPHLTGKELRV